MKRRIFVAVAATLLTACAGISKDCAKLTATNFGSAWIVVQYDMAGRPFHCWKLRSASVGSTEGGQVDWQSADGHLVHLTGWENRVQVMRGDFVGAGRLLGIDADRCGNGAYPATP